MEEEIKAVDANDENNSDQEETETEDKSTDEVDASEVDPYEAELQRLAKEKELSETIARQKTGALKEEKLKRQKLEERLEKLEKGFTSVNKDELIEQLRIEIKTDTEIERLANNENEKKLIKEYVKKGLSVEDAFVLANKHVVIDARKKAMESDSEESALARLSGASFGGSTGRMSEITRLASEGLSEKERKHLSSN